MLNKLARQLQEDELRHLMLETLTIIRPDFMPVWWTTPLPCLKGKSPLNAWRDGDREEIRNVVRLLGSGEPV